MSEARDLKNFSEGSDEESSEAEASDSDDGTARGGKGMWLSLGVLIGGLLVGSIVLITKWLATTPRPTVQMWQTSESGPDNRLAKQLSVPIFSDDFAFTGPVVDIATTSVMEDSDAIVGFGGAFTDASALVFQKLTPEAQNLLMEGYFGEHGLGYTTGRVHINSCDFSMENYAFDDVDGDLNLTHFDTNVSKNIETGLIPLIQRAQEVLLANGKTLKLLATPWSPPAWMKRDWKGRIPEPDTADQPLMHHGPMDHSASPCLKSGVEQAWASYFDKWISAYNAHGIPIYAITVQNEAENNATWEGCLFTAQEEADFLANYLGPTLEATHPDVQIYVFDHNKDHVYHWAKTIFENPEAAKYADGIAFHWYSGDNFEDLDRIKKEFPKKKLWATEATWEQWRWQPGTQLGLGDWSFGEGFAHDMIGDLNAGSIGYIDWNLVLDETGGPNHVGNVCDSAMMANLTTGELFYHPQYYFIGHFSKFITPGSKLLNTEVTGTSRYTGNYSYACKYLDPPMPDDGVQCRGYGVCSDHDGLEVTSFLRPDGRVVSVALNCGETGFEFKLKYGAHAAKTFIPPSAIQTYLFDIP